MKEYLFVFGRNKKLSLLEIVSYLIKKEFKYSIIKITDDFADVLIDNFDAKESIKELGGIIKIGEEFDLNKIIITKNRINYGINFFHKDEEILDELKNLFRKEKVKAIMKRPRNSFLFMPKESRKLDIELVVLKKRIFNVAVNSNPSEFKLRDEKRPYFDRLKVTSLRLAKILINLSQARENEVLLDPFCGAGSILQEALLMGINTIGLDNDKKSYEGCLKNLEWVKEKYRLNKEYKIYFLDNKNIDKAIKEADAVVTEPYFGPFFNKIPKYEDVVKIIKEVEEIYYNLFLKLKKIVKKNRIIVFPVPVYKTSKGKVTLDFEKIIKKTGFEIYSPVPNIEVPINYSLKGSIVSRRIYLLKNT
ncbi:hypothetical protein HYX16_00570 [Candidatus Woesearchaeota archaeon]|nr:hypothetical protein [Candidatus Woesearchaeota archaeon]